MRLPASSLRHRLALAAAFVGLTFAVLFGGLALWRIHHAEDAALTAALRSRIELARDEVAPDGSIQQDAGSPQTDLVQVLGPDGTVLASSPALSGARPLVDIRGVTKPGGQQVPITLRHPPIELAALAVPLSLSASPRSPAGTGALVVAVDTEGFTAATSDLLWLLAVGLLLVVAAMAALAWILTGRALSSVTRLTENAEAVHPGDLGSGLPVPRRDVELTRLVEALNRMLARLHHAHATELAFAADAGHRLRTPVATLRAEAELALHDAARDPDPEALTAALDRIVADADRLTSIVDGMLARARSQTRAPQPVRAVLDGARERWYRQATLAGVRLQLDIADPIGRDVHCVALAETTDPVVDNAVRHAGPQGWVRVVVTIGDCDPGVLELTVTNGGPAVPESLRPHLFDAWVSGRDASVAGGLGLWLARETARDLGGEVTLVDAAPTTFRVSLPLTPGTEGTAPAGPCGT